MLRPDALAAEEDRRAVASQEIAAAARQARAEAIAVDANPGAALFRQIEAWSAATFPTSTQESTMKHLLREMVELSCVPGDTEEMADLIHLLIQLSRFAGGGLWEALERKFAKNRARTWQAPDHEGVIEHVREPAA